MIKQEPAIATPKPAGASLVAVTAVSAPTPVPEPVPRDQDMVDEESPSVIAEKAKGAASS